MERKKIMTWILMWLNMSAAALNITFQLLVIYRFVLHMSLQKPQILQPPICSVIPSGFTLMMKNHTLNCHSNATGTICFTTNFIFEVVIDYE